MKSIPPILLVSLLFFISCRQNQPPELRAPLFNNLGSYEMKISTGNEWCQKFFNQGIALTYGFNHAEAHRAFMEAARLDSNCAMAYWGAALVNGPNINAPMFDTVYPSTYRLVQKAISKMKWANEKEKALITALSQRYPSAEPAADRSAYDQAYADAMRKVYQQFPEDDDVATMAGEALMDLHPWNLWLRDGNPQPWTMEIVEIFEKVLARNPNHPGANHYYIHAVEASPDPGKALDVSARLPALVPGAGHLVHMPSHIYIRTGDYHKASIANEEAIKADSSYFAQCHAQGFYPATYANHNVHFLFITAAFEGRSKAAIAAAEVLTSKVPHEQLHDPAWGPTLEQFAWMNLLAYIRFGRWDTILSAARPDSTLGFSMAMWHYARGYAQVAKNSVADAEKELASLSQIAADTFYKTQLIFGINNQYDILNVAVHALAGEIESMKNHFEKSSHHFQEAIRIEDGLNYNEPPDWFFPVRHAYGSMLIEHGKFAEAEQVFRDDLRYNLNNPWAMFGLYQSLSQQGKAEEAAKFKTDFDRQWQHADFELTAARLL